jgi:methionyl-tRNA formyltransferase
MMHGERVRIWSAQAIDAPVTVAPGVIQATHRDAIDIATGDGLLRIDELQREGGRRVAVRDWLNARRDSDARDD